MKTLTFPVTLILLFCLGLSKSSEAQNNQKDSYTIELNEIRSLSESQKNQPNSTPSLSDSTLPWLEPILSYDRMDPVDPFLNFDMSRGPLSFGDINGDGYMDFGINTNSRTWNENSSTDEKTRKTIIYYGNQMESRNAQQLYSHIIPMGDLNGDGFADAVGDAYEFTFHWFVGSADGLIRIDSSFTVYEIDNRVFSFNSYTNSVIDLDLNRDGIGDVIVFDYPTTIAVFLGNEQITSITPFGVGNARVGYEKTKSLVVDIDNDDIVEVITYADWGKTFSIYKVNTIEKNMEPFQIESITTETDSVQIQFGDFNGDRLNELLLFQRGFSTKLFAQDTTTHKVITETFTTISDGRTYIPLGDLNADSIQDLGFYDPNQSIYAIGFGKISNSFNYSADIILSKSEFESLVPNNNEFYSDTNPKKNQLIQYSYKPLVQRDTDILLDIQAKEFTTESNNFSTKTHISYLNNELVHVDKNMSSFNLGDINGDSIEDFGVTFSDRGELHVFYGGTLKTEPDVIYSVREPGNDSTNYFMYSGIAMGDINGDGHKDLLLSSQNHSFIRVFLGTASGIDTDYDYSFSPFESLQEIYWLECVGDLDEDGFDDFIVSNLDLDKRNLSTDLVKIIYGNAELSSLVIKPVSFTTEPTIQPISYFGYRIKALGDINEDAISDFAISYRYWRNTENRLTGAVLLYYGKKEQTDYLVADSILVANNTNIRELGFTFETQFDFNGDGYGDIAYAGVSTNAIPNLGEIDFGKNRGKSLIYLPNTVLNYTEWPNRYSSNFRGGLFGINDIQSDGKDELLFTSGFSSNYNAGIFYGKTGDLSSYPDLVFKGVNTQEDLGGPYHVAVGDFDGNPETREFVFTQSNGSKKGHQVGTWHIYQVDAIPTSNELVMDELTQFSLEQNYPNPFNPTTTIRFSLAQSNPVVLTIYNSLGQQVASPILNKHMNRGVHSIEFDASKLSSGVYFYHLQSGEQFQIRKMLLIK